MFRLKFFTALAVALPLSLFGQNLLPNPSFDSYTTCPSSIGNLPGYLSDWDRANTASPDYGNCGFSGNSAIRFTPRSGSGVIGMWGGASHPSCATSAYSEAIRADLTSPMSVGQVYDVSVAVRVDGVGTSTANPNNCVDFGMYFYHSSSPPPSAGWCCLPVVPQWSISGASVLDGVYTVFTGTITATGNFDRVVIGPFCNSNTGGASCGNYGTARMYFNLDDVSAAQSIVLDEGQLSLQGDAYSDFNALAWEFAEGLSFDRFQLERGADAERMEVIHEGLAEEGRHLFNYRDETPLEGENFYRVTGIDAEGAVFHSELVRLQRGMTAGDGAGRLNYFYDSAAEEIRFSLDTERGGNFALDLIDLSGRVLSHSDYEQAPGIQDFTLPVNGLSQGVYVLRLRSLSHGGIWQNKFAHR